MLNVSIRKKIQPKIVSNRPKTNKMKNRLQKKIKARSSWRYYKSKRLAINKYPALKETIEDFWKELETAYLKRF